MDWKPTSARLKYMHVIDVTNKHNKYKTAVMERGHFFVKNTNRNFDTTAVSLHE